MAEVSVRPARSDDAAEIARIQVDTWRTGYRDLLPAPIIESLSAEAVQPAWTEAVEAPPSDQHHVLVAQEQQWLVGFAAVGPVDSDEAGITDTPHTAQIAPLLVEPRWGRRGHGSRLLAAAVDHARSDGFTRLITWVPAGDGASLSFYRSAGWDTDGFARVLDTGVGEMREIRLHVALEPAA